MSRKQTLVRPYIKYFKMVLYAIDCNHSLWHGNNFGKIKYREI